MKYQLKPNIKEFETYLDFGGMTDDFLFGNIGVDWSGTVKMDKITSILYTWTLFEDKKSQLSYIDTKRFSTYFTIIVNS